MRPGDLSRCDLVIVADVGRGIAAPMLELDREAHPELLDVKRRAAPVDSNPFADLTGLFGREITVIIHRPSLTDPPKDAIRSSSLGIASSSRCQHVRTAQRSAYGDENGTTP